MTFEQEVNEIYLPAFLLGSGFLLQQRTDGYLATVAPHGLLGNAEPQGVSGLGLVGIGKDDDLAMAKWEQLVDCQLVQSTGSEPQILRKDLRENDRRLFGLYHTDCLMFFP